MVGDPFAHLADDLFPFVSGRGAGHSPLISLPHRGNGLEVRCFGCGREVAFSGHRLTTEFLGRLPWTIGQFVAALRCGNCSGKRLVGYVVRDPNAEGFSHGPHEVAQVVWARRLSSWLAEAGSDLWAFQDVLADLPCDALLAQAGIQRHGA